VSELARAVAELRDFAERLRARPDLQVVELELGAPADAATLAALGDVPDELRELYALMDGATIEWRFVEPGVGGTLHIPAARFARWQGDEQHYTRFGDDFEAIELDRIGDGSRASTYLVRPRGGGPAVLLFQDIQVAPTIADYLRRAMDHGLVEWWPKCFRDDPWVSHEAQEDAIRRFRAPRVPVPIVPGGRVHHRYFAEGGRGQVLRLHQAPPDHREADWMGTTFAEVQLDEGTRAWLPSRFLRGQAEVDAYERLRAGLPPVSPALPVLETLARAIGPNSSHGPVRGPSNSRPAAGLLAPHDFEAGMDWVLALYDAALAEKLPFREELPLPRTGDELAPTETACARWRHRVDDTFEGLFWGLALRVQHLSAVAGAPPGTLVAAERQQRLRRAGKSAPLREQLASTEVLAPPDWTAGTRAVDAAVLGLPPRALVLAGEGY
jgi:hypothetical protein